MGRGGASWWTVTGTLGGRWLIRPSTRIRGDGLSDGGSALSRNRPRRWRWRRRAAEPPRVRIARPSPYAVAPDEVERPVEGLDAIAQVEIKLRAMGWRDASHGARLIVAMAAEVALSEHESAGKQHGARRSMRRFIERGCTT
jgi:hypothetical protein